MGLILASQALGASVGAIAFSRFVAPARRVRWMGPLAVTACGILIAFVFRPPLPIALAILAAERQCSTATSSLRTHRSSRAAPAQYRSSAFGVAQAGMSLGQGAAIILAGAAAQIHSPSSVIAAGGAIGALCVRLRGQPCRTRSSPPGGADDVGLSSPEVTEALQEAPVAGAHGGHLCGMWRGPSGPLVPRMAVSFRWRVWGGGSGSAPAGAAHGGLLPVAGGWGGVGQAHWLPRMAVSFRWRGGVGGGCQAHWLPRMAVSFRWRGVAGAVRFSCCRVMALLLHMLG